MVPFNTSRPPALIHINKPPHDPEFHENFPRTAKWNWDGSTVLVQYENRTFQRLDLPSEFLDLPPSEPAEGGATFNYEMFQQPSPILDFVWYPNATPKDPASFCFVASVRESPVKLLDASDGRLRASYPIVDHCERQIAPHSMAFNLPTTKLYCGCEDAIEVFDIHSPGEGTRLATTPSRKSKDGLKGIISAMAFSPSYDLYAAGSLIPSTPNIALFSESEGGNPIMFIGTELNVKAGVTQLLFDPTKPHILYASLRRHEPIYCWDLRGDVSYPIKKFVRNANVNGATNQKMRFDVDSSGCWLGVGDQNGDVSLFTLNSEGRVEKELESPDSQIIAEAGPTFKYHAQDDAIGSVAFHPLHPVLLSASGSRHFPELPSPSCSSGSSDDENVHMEKNRAPTKVISRRHYPVTLDASIKMWRFHSSADDSLMDTTQAVRNVS